MTDSAAKPLGFETLALHAGAAPDPTTNSRAAWENGTKPPTSSKGAPFPDWLKE